MQRGRCRTGIYERLVSQEVVSEAFVSAGKIAGNQTFDS